MKHIIKYRGVLHESESAPVSKLEDVRYLFDLSIIDKKELIEAIIKISVETDTPIESMIRPDDYYFEIEETGDWEVDGRVGEWIRNWTGPRGEVALYVFGTAWNDGYQANILLSTGDTLIFEYSWVDGHWSSITVNGTSFNPAVKDVNVIFDKYEATDDEETFIHDLFNLTLHTSY
jgi:hypothetical protein